MTFAERLLDRARLRGLALAGPTHPEPLAGLAYADELSLKREALATFWAEHRLPGAPEPVVPTPAPRGYRTTSKRRAQRSRSGLALGFPGLALGRGVAPSALDRPEHLPVYEWLSERLTRPASAPLAAVLNHVVLRGSGEALALILNVTAFDARVVRAAKLAAEALAGASLGVRSAFLYLDPSGSDYYLEARRPRGVLSCKRLLGPDHLEAVVEGVRLRFPPTAFSQVSGAMASVLVATVRELAAPLDGRRLLDLYCGHGLLSLTVGRGAAEVLGVELDGPAVEAARGNARHARGLRPARFLAGRVEAGFLTRHLPPPFPGGEVVVLDPPRQGTAEGVAVALAARRPERVVHVLCGTDELPRELLAWSRVGYRPRRVVPLDLFAGTAGLETVVLLAPAG